MVSWFRNDILQFSAPTKTTCSSPSPPPTGATKGKDHRFRKKQITGNSNEKGKQTVTAKILTEGTGKETIQEKNTHQSTLNNRPPFPPSNGQYWMAPSNTFSGPEGTIFSEKNPHDMWWYRIMSVSQPLSLSLLEPGHFPPDNPKFLPSGLLVMISKISWQLGFPVQALSGLLTLKEQRPLRDQERYLAVYFLLSLQQLSQKPNDALLHPWNTLSWGNRDQVVISGPSSSSCSVGPVSSLFLTKWTDLILDFFFCIGATAPGMGSSPGSAAIWEAMVPVSLLSYSSSGGCSLVLNCVR